MDLISTLIFLSSGLFLGWSLGANDASNVFGTAVGSRMVRFSTAAIICSVFIIIGSVTAGAGAAGGLGKLGAVNALAGSFTVALAAAITVLWMTKLGLPVSTSQAVVGAIVGWNWFSGSITNIDDLIKIMGTWVACPILAAMFAAVVYKLVVLLIENTKPHLLSLDNNVRWGLILVGAFGSYTLGANNIGNVMGVFVPSSPFEDLKIAGILDISAVEQLFLLGAIAIAIGVFTYSKQVMMTVGGSLMTLSPVGALVVVLANSLVLFTFSSQELSNFVASLGLPPIPLIPVSSSQAVVGAVIGIALLKGIKGIRQVKWGVLGGIASGWITTPVIAAIIGFILLFIVQNVFNQEVYKTMYFRVSPPVLEKLVQMGIATEQLSNLQGETIAQARNFRTQLRQNSQLTAEQERQAIALSQLYPMKITSEKIASLERKSLSSEQIKTISQLQGQSFDYIWQLREALAQQSPTWQLKEDQNKNTTQNKKLSAQLAYVQHHFSRKITE